jgi:hypothetical protein
VGVPIYQHTPARCPFGHHLVPPYVQFGWAPCGCPAAVDRAESGRGAQGHLTVWCIVCEEDGGRKTRYYEPAHTGEDVRVPGARIKREGPGNWVTVPIGPDSGPPRAPRG